jgi:hypothetical protein
LDQNYVSEITNLQVYPNLTILSLKNNAISQIELDAFANLTMLEKLELEGNPLQTISGPIFEDLSDLQELNLRSTELLSLHDSVFAGLSQLITLSLGSNNLETLSADTFSTTTELSSISLRGNDIKTLQEDLFESLPPTYSVDLTDNPLSCDCELLWLYSAAQNRSSVLTDPSNTLCHWPDYLRSRQLTSLVADDFLCFGPTLVEEQEDQTVRTTERAVLACNVTAQPRPLVTWYRGGQMLIRSNGYRNESAGDSSLFGRLTILGDGSLEIADVMHEDQGEYFCVAGNSYGNISSNTSYLTVLESTCFNGEQDAHETDVDCGGIYCDQCSLSQKCRQNTDCSGELVCLFYYQLPSSLLYISSENARAYTCDNQSVPQILLEERLKASLLEIGYPVTLNETIQNVLDNLRSFLSTALDIPLLSVNNVNIVTIARKYEPLIQVWFDVQRSRQGEDAVSSLTRQLNDGVLLGTLKVDSTSSDRLYRVRLNV